PIADTGPIDCREHFQPKVHGLNVLEHILRGREVDFCLLFSSLSSVLGGIRFAAYSAANLYMDAVAHRQSRGSHTSWISINWDGWHRSETAESLAGLASRSGDLSLTPEEGVACLERILSLK